MVTLSVTRTRIAAVLRRAGELAATGWDSHRRPLAALIDEAALYVPGVGSTDAEAATLLAWDAVELAVLGVTGMEFLLLAWERHPHRTQTDVVAALTTAAEQVTRRDPEPDDTDDGAHCQAVTQ